ncbi:MAG: osmotically-inducible protein OsmY [Phenylobacterium sp.]|jgi:osmotically-inducible protein OsmY
MINASTQANTTTTFLVKSIAALLLLSQLQGCAAIVIAGAAGAATAANDSRTLGVQLDDSSIEVKAAMALSAIEGLDNHTHINLVSVNGNLLAVGQATSTFLRDSAVKALSTVEGVKRVHNQIKIGSITSILTQTNDGWITSKVKFKLLAEKSIRSNNIKVVTENAEVFLMGLVSKEESVKAAEVARNISGVVKVIKMFEVM